MKSKWLSLRGKYQGEILSSIKDVSTILYSKNFTTKTLVCKGMAIPCHAALESLKKSNLPEIIKIMPFFFTYFCGYDLCVKIKD